MDLKKVDMRPNGLKKIVSFALNMLFAFLTLAMAFGLIWFFYLIIEIQRYG